MTLIQLDEASLTFWVRRRGRVSLKEYLLTGMFRRRSENYIRVDALDKVSLTVNEGERLGIIGHNGAGKSTLLKLIAGIYPPSSGRRAVRGHISSLFDITLGFEMDATGWENMMYRGYLLGENPKSIRAKMQAIAEFSELGQFLDMPVRYYSAGMMVRLAFSISTAIQPDILIVDEVLSAGDMEFQTKARERMRGLISSARAVVAVSHDLGSLGQLCDRVVWLEQGRVQMIGATKDVIDAYAHQCTRPQHAQAA